MSNGIDLSKPLLIDACFSCYEAKIPVEPHQDKIEPGQFLLDLIYKNVFSPYFSSYLRAKYYIIFFDYNHKTLEVILYLNQNRVLSAFDLFQKRNQFREARIKRFCTDGRGEYNSHFLKTIMRSMTLYERLQY